MMKNLSRRSFFGFLGGALATVGLDGPAKAMASLSDSLARPLRTKKKPSRIVVYVIDITVKSEMSFAITLEEGSTKYPLSVGWIPPGGRYQLQLNIDGGVVIEKGKSLVSVSLWPRWNPSNPNLVLDQFFFFDVAANGRFYSHSTLTSRRASVGFGGISV